MSIKFSFKRFGLRFSRFKRKMVRYAEYYTNETGHIIKPVLLKKFLNVTTKVVVEYLILLHPSLFLPRLSFFPISRYYFVGSAKLCLKTIHSFPTLFRVGAPF